MSEYNDRLRFSVDSSLLIQLSQQLVAKPSVALAELVKNAYDADATQVRLHMHGVDKLGGTITVEDNGHGMTFEEIQTDWMRIATTTKQNEPESRKYRRSVTGAKGIGRLAAWRLGTLVTLESVAYQKEGPQKEKTFVIFDWSDFATGMDIASIPVEYERAHVPEDHPTGVTLTIENAKDAWKKDEIIALKRDLLSLQSPFSELVRQADIQKVSIDPGFTLQIEIGGSELLEPFSGDLLDEVTSLSLMHLSGRVDRDGTAHYELKIQNQDELYEMTDKIEDYGDLQNVEFQIYYFSERAINFANSILGLRDFRSVMKRASGVRVYLNRFRVFPYGEDGDDWLGLDYYASQNVDMAKYVLMPKRIRDMIAHVRIDAKEAGGSDRPFLLIPRNRQVLGAVLLSQTRANDLEGNRIEITTSREGLIVNRAYEKLVRFLQRGIYWLTLKHFETTIRTRAKAGKERDQDTESRRSVPEAIEKVRARIESLTVELSTVFTVSDTAGESSAQMVPNVEPEIVERVLKHKAEEMAKSISELKSVIEQLGEAGQQAGQEKEDTISYISMLRLLASAGTALLLMQHQILGLVDHVNLVRHSLRQLRTDIPENIGERYDDIVQDVGTWHDLLTEQLSQLSFILSPVNRQRRRRHALREIVGNVRKSLSYFMGRNHVEFSNGVPADLRTPLIFRAELYAVLLNILTNALKAVDHQEERRISVTAHKVDKRLCIRMFNTGTQISPLMREKAFEPFASDSIPNPTLGTGTGLGLTVVRDTVESYDGEVQFIDVEPPWRTGIEITIPYR